MSQDDLEGRAATWAREDGPPELRNGSLQQLLDAYRDGHCRDEATGGYALTDRGRHALQLLTNLLAKPILQTAQRLAARVGRRWGHDLEDEALADVLTPRQHSLSRICEFRPNGGSLAGWLWQVLGRLVLTRRRQAERHPVRPPSDLPWQDVSAPDLTGPFEPDDLDRLRRWAVHQRVELLCLGGLWLKVPPEEWDAWVGEYEQSRDLCLSRPFPPKDFFFSHGTPQKRTRPLADVLCYPPNTLTQRWRRHHKRLEELSFIRDHCNTETRAAAAAEDSI